MGQWHWPKVLSEFISAAIIVVGFLLIYVVVKRKKFGLDSVLKQTCFAAFGVAAVTVVGRLFGMAWESSHSWANPAYAVTSWFNDGAGIFEHSSFDSTTIYYGIEAAIGMIAGGFAGGAIFIGIIEGRNAMVKEDKVNLKEIFTWTKKEWTSNMPLAFTTGLIGLGMLIFGSEDFKGIVSPSNPYSPSYLLPLGWMLVVGGAVAVIVATFAIGIDGFIYLNPTVWIGMFMAKLWAQKGRMNGMNFLSEASIPILCSIGGIIAGCVIHGINTITP